MRSRSPVGEYFYTSCMVKIHHIPYAVFLPCAWHAVKKTSRYMQNIGQLYIQHILLQWCGQLCDVYRYLITVNMHAPISLLVTWMTDLSYFCTCFGKNWNGLVFFPFLRRWKGRHNLSIKMMHRLLIDSMMSNLQQHCDLECMMGYTTAILHTAEKENKNPWG